jgi:RecB family exonuclease
MELRLALRAAGAARLRQAARLSVDPLLDGRGRVALPLRQGLTALEEEGEPSSRAPRRTLDGGHLRRAVLAAQALVERLEGWPEKEPAGRHLDRLEALLRDDLAWSEEFPAVRPILEALAEARRQVPEVLELERGEVHRLVSAMLKEVGWGVLGGRGGGVQILTVTEARALTFEHLFLVGLNRNVFPRTVREDPLLPDSLRRVLGSVLPDIPIKRRGFEEERYLFAQLLSAAPHLTLSWQTEDDDGAARSPSPLVERLRRHLDLGEGEGTSEGTHEGISEGTGPFDPADLQPAEDRALNAAFAAGRSALRPLYGTALREAWSEPFYPLDPARLAAVRLRLLAEVDPDLTLDEGRRRTRSAGPYLGYLAPLERATAGDPRHRPLYVTLLERLAGCPWQTFLTRLLGIEPVSDPLEALPGIDRLLLGDAVHGVLEKILEEGFSEATTEVVGTLDEALRRDPVPVSWPSSGRLEVLLRQESERVLWENGMPLPGLARALARRAHPYLEVAREQDFAAPLEALGAEVEGVLDLTVGGRKRHLHFRADRVDRVDRVDRFDGSDPEEVRIRLTDYKTGKAVSEAQREVTRRRHFLQKVAEGGLLQAVTYRLAVQNRRAEGRYLYLKPDLEDAWREATTEGDGEALEAAFRATVEAVLPAWDAGAFFPRLTDPEGEKEPDRCRYCPVAEACSRHDSGARRRLVEVATTGAGGEAMGRLWQLG